MRTCTGRVLVVFLGLLPACVTLTQDPRTVILAADGGLQVRSLTCAEVVPPLVAPFVVRYGGAGLSWVFPASGVAMAVPLAVVSLYPVWAMWRPPSERT